MLNDLVQITYDRPDLVRLTPLGSAHDISLIPGILAAFDQQYRNRIRTFIIDLSHLDELPPSLVVLLLELTARARRHGGEVTLVNLFGRTREDLTGFDPLGYLHIVEEAAEPEPDQPEALPHENANGRTGESLSIPSRPDVVYKACDFVVQIGRRLGFSENEVNKIKLAVYEACLNVVEHAYHSDPTKKLTVVVYSSPQQIEIQVIDQGDGFEATDDDFDVMAAAAARQTGGMGLHIIRRSMDAVSYQRNTPEGNKLIMIKRC
ncbi:ATP-binding protein [bacterium]|nr:ATP-binding protein [bacterium]